jgi:LysM repeat protein
MIEQSANSQDSTHDRWQHPPLAANAASISTAEVHTIRKDVCPECGEHVQGQVDACPACGANLAQAPKQIRCMHCHTTASSELVICPGCGRELREAPPKLMTYGVPALLALLLVTLIATQWQRVSPIAWARTNLVRGVGLVENISASIEPEMVIVMTPIVEETPDSAFIVMSGDDAVISDTQAVALAPNSDASNGAVSESLVAESVITPIPDANATPSGEVSILAAAVAEESPVGVGGPEATPEPVGASMQANVAAEALPTETPAFTDTPLPTDTPLATATSLPPTATLEPTVVRAVQPTFTPTPTWTVMAGDANAKRGVATAQATATSEAARLVVLPTEPVVAAGGMAQVAALAANETTLPTSLPTSTATPTLVVTPLPTPTSTPVVYQVKAGDTLVTIAASYDVGVDELMAANSMSEQDVYGIQPGQMLFVPVPTPEPVASSIRVDAPVLLVPPADATVGCATGGTLMWQRVQFVKDSDKYVLHLGFVNGQDSNGQESITWVLAQSGPVTQTEWTLDTGLCDLTPADFGHQWRWWVEVVEGGGENGGGTVPVSPPSEVRGFTWQ